MKATLVLLSFVLHFCVYSQENNLSGYKKGDKALVRFFEKELHYPEKAVVDNLSSILFLKMSFDRKNGRITNWQTSDGSKGDFSNEVLRVAKLLKGQQFQNTAGKIIIIPFEFLHGDTNRKMQINRDELFSENAFFNTNAIILKPIIIISKSLTRTN